MDGVKDEKFEYYGGSLQNPIFRGKWGDVHEKPIYRGELPKKEGLGEFTDLSGGAWQKRGGGVLRGLITQCILW